MIDDVLSLIDGATPDIEVSSDAMRWKPYGGQAIRHVLPRRHDAGDTPPPAIAAEQVGAAR